MCVTSIDIYTPTTTNVVVDVTNNDKYLSSLMIRTYVVANDVHIYDDYAIINDDIDRR
jgi:hypothetical protein